MRTVMHFYYYQQDNEVIRAMETYNGYFPKVPTLSDIVYYTIMHTIQVIRLLSFILLFLTEYLCKSVHCVNSELGNIGIMCLRGLTLKAHNRITQQPHFQLTIIALNGCG